MKAVNKQVLDGKLVLTNEADNTTLLDLINEILEFDRENISEVNLKIMVGYFWYAKEISSLFFSLKKISGDGLKLKVQIIMSNHTSLRTIQLMQHAKGVKISTLSEDESVFVDCIEKGMIEFRFPNLDENNQPEKKIHSKFYLFKFNNKLKHALIGSCNISKTGLMQEHEAVVKAPDETYGQLEALFDKIWSDVKMVDTPEDLIPKKNLDKIISEKEIPEIISANDIQLLSLVIWSLNLEQTSQNGHLSFLQEFDLNRSLDILEKHNSVFLASSVGMGKSYVIKEIIRNYLSQGAYSQWALQSNNSKRLVETENERKHYENYIVILFAPTVIIAHSEVASQWYKVLKDGPNRILQKVSLLTTDDKDQKGIKKGLLNFKNDKEAKIWLAGNGALRAFDQNDWDSFFNSVKSKISDCDGILFVFDEAHHFRNKNSSTTATLKRKMSDLSFFCHDNNKDFKTVLSSATPLNTKFEDLTVQMDFGFYLKNISERLSQTPLCVQIYSKIKDLVNQKDVEPDEIKNSMELFRHNLLVKSEWVDLFHYPENLVALISNETNKKAALDNIRDLKSKIKPGNTFLGNIIIEKTKKYTVAATLFEELWEKIQVVIPQLHYVPYSFVSPEYLTLDEYVKSLGENNWSYVQKSDCSDIFYNYSNSSEKHLAGFVCVSKNSNPNLAFIPKFFTNLQATYKIILAKRAESSIYSFLLTLIKLDFKYFLFTKLNEICNSSNNPDKLLPKLLELYKNQVIGKHSVSEIFDILNLINANQSNSVEDEEDYVDYPDESVISTTLDEKIIKSNLDLIRKLQSCFCSCMVSRLNENIIWSSITENEMTYPELNTINNIVNEDIHAIHDVLSTGFEIIFKINNRIIDDPKVEKLIETLVDFKQKPKINKVITFAYFTDTLKYLKYYFETRRISLDSPYFYSSDSELETLTLARRFNSTTSNDRIDNLFTTDVLAEGVNLGEGRYFVNYDIEFNPVRIIQRAGRILRIGWFADNISIYNDFLSLEKEIHLIIPLENYVSETLASILIKVEDRLLKIIQFVGLEFALLDYNTLKSAVQTRESLLEYLVRRGEADPTKAGGSGSQNVGLLNMYNKYLELKNEGKIGDVSNQVYNYFLENKVFEENGKKLIKFEPIATEKLPLTGSSPLLKLLECEFSLDSLENYEILAKLISGGNITNVSYFYSNVGSSWINKLDALVDKKQRALPPFNQTNWKKVNIKNFKIKIN